MSVRLYVGNLPAELDRHALEQVFHDSGESLSVKVITDRKSGRCRGFGFVTVENDERADSVIERFNGFDFNGAVLKLEKALPRQKEKEEGDDRAVEQETNDDGGSTEDKGEEKMPAKRKKRRNKKPSNRPELRSTPSTSEFHQPDPRWASELEEFKQRLLAAQSN